MQARSWLRATAWHYLLGLFIFMTLAEMLFSAGAQPGSWRDSFRRLPELATLLLVIGKCAADGYGGHARFLAAKAERRPWSARIVALLPLALLAWIRTDQANLRSCRAWLLRRPHAPRTAGLVLPTHEKSGYGTVFMMVLLSTFVELPIHAFIISVMIKDPDLQFKVHLVSVLVVGYTLLWILGDRYAVLGSSHVAGQSALDLKVGNRLSASVPYSAIVKAEALGTSPAQWCKKHGIAMRQTMQSTPVDPPNMVLQIDPAAGLTLTRWQIRRPAADYLFLFVDQPSMMVAAIKDRQTALS